MRRNESENGWRTSSSGGGAFPRKRRGSGRNPAPTPDSTHSSRVRHCLFSSYRLASRPLLLFTLFQRLLSCRPVLPLALFSHTRLFHPVDHPASRSIGLTITCDHVVAGVCRQPDLCCSHLPSCSHRWPAGWSHLGQVRKGYSCRGESTLFQARVWRTGSLNDAQILCLCICV